MEPLRIQELLAAAHGEAVSALVTEGTKDPFVKVRAEGLPAVAATLRDHPELAFDNLMNLTAVDWPKAGRIDVVYHFHSIHHRHRFAVKVELPRDRPEIASLSGLWAGANWLEREQWDLMGVRFTGHPDLRRLLLPDDWVGHPLRKDYQEAPEYRGMKTTRPNPLDLLALHDQAHAIPMTPPPAAPRPPAPAPAAAAPGPEAAK
jgi:NADH-quinone oxidoreductase subunit C